MSGGGFGGVDYSPIPVTSLPASVTSGVEYRLPYPGSSLFWDGAKYGGTLGNAFADLAAIQAVPSGVTSLLALGTTAKDITGKAYSWQSAGWVADGVVTSSDILNRRSIYCGLLGDSIVAQSSSLAQQFVQRLNWRIVMNKAVGGGKIADQNQYLPEIKAEGCDCVVIQVGTNNANSPGTAYADYVSLYSAARALGLAVVAIAIPPRDATTGVGVYKVNVANYYACKKLGIPLYYPWGQFALVGGGWSSGTMASDGIHPDDESRALALAALLTQWKEDLQYYPQSLTSFDGIILNPCFVGDTNADGVANSWLKGSSDATASYSISAYGANGQYQQNMVLTDPEAGDKAQVYQTLTTGFAVGDRLLFHGELDCTVPNGAYDSGLFQATISMQRVDSSQITKLSGPAHVANGKWAFEGVVPAECTKIRVTMSIACASAKTGVFTASVRGYGCANLTAYGITP